MWDFEFAMEVEKINAGHISIILAQCYSGGFIDDLEGEGRTIATACRFDQLSYAMPPSYQYNEFVFHWTAAATGSTPDETPVYAEIRRDLAPDQGGAVVPDRKPHGYGHRHEIFRGNPADAVNPGTGPENAPALWGVCRENGLTPLSTKQHTEQSLERNTDSCPESPVASTRSNPPPPSW